MGLEAGDSISILDENWPLATDDKREGDNHIRLLKHVLRTTFPNAIGKFSFPSTMSIATSTNLVPTDQNKLILANTAAGSLELRMPSLTPTDEGWRVTIIKHGGLLNPVFVFPPSGTIFSGEVALPYVRRCIHQEAFDVMFVGGSWWAQRLCNAPLASIIPCFRGLPPGFEWPNGQNLPGSAYPEYRNVRTGANTAAFVDTPDLRERILAGGVLGAGAAGRIVLTRSGIDPLQLGAAGGFDVTTLAHHQMPYHVHKIRKNTIVEDPSGAGFFRLDNHSLGHSHGGETGESGSLDHAHDFTDSTFNAANSTAAGGNPPGGSAGTTPRTTTGNVASGYDLKHRHSISTALNGATDGLHNVLGFTQYTGGIGADGTPSDQTQSRPSDTAPAGTAAHQNMPPTFICNYALVVE